MLGGVLLIMAAVIAQSDAQPAPPPLVITPPPLPEGMPTQIEPAARAAALKLAQFLYSEDRQMSAAARMFDTSVGAAFAKSPDMQFFEEEYPGFIEAVVVEMRPIMLESTREFLPDYHRKAAEVYATYLTAAEIEDLQRFYEGPTGEKILNGMLENYRIDSILSDVMEDPDGPASYYAVSKDHHKAIAATKKLIEESDHSALIAITKKPYAKRLMAAGSAIRRLDHQLLNEPDPELDRQIEAVFNAVLKRFEDAAAVTGAE